MYGFEGIRGKLDNRGEDRQAMLKKKELGTSGINSNLPQISERREVNEDKDSAISLGGNENAANPELVRCDYPETAIDIEIDNNKDAKN